MTFKLRWNKALKAGKQFTFLKVREFNYLLVGLVFFSLAIVFALAFSFPLSIIIFSFNNYIEVAYHIYFMLIIFLFFDIFMMQLFMDCFKMWTREYIKVRKDWERDING